MTTLTRDVGRGLVPELPPAGRAAVRGGVIGNYVDQLNIFLPVTALAPAMPTIGGPGVVAATAAYVVAATLVGRPVGAMIFGRIADRVGRTRTTRVAIAGTAACTLGIAAVPTYQAIGGWAVVWVIALRFVGGAFLAGEYTSAIPLAMEWSSPRRRGLVSGRIMSMAPWAQGTIALATFFLMWGLGLPAYSAWGWRLSFVAGGLASVGMLVYYSRRVADAPKAKAVSAGARGRLRDVLVGAHSGRLWRVFALMTGLWFMTNMVVIALPGRLALDAGISAGQVPLVMVVASVAQALAMSVTGHWSTLLGRRRFLVWSGLVGLICGPVLLWAVLRPGPVWAIAAGAAALQVLTVCAYGPMGAYLSELFAASVRSTGYGTAYSLSIVVPALYPTYLPWLAWALGDVGAMVALVGLGASLVVAGAASGPRLGPVELDAGLDAVAESVGRR